MKKKLLAYAFVPTVMGLGLLGATTASADTVTPVGKSISPDDIASHQLQAFQKTATLLGISVDEVKQAWATGKSVITLAKEKGITEAQLGQKMKDSRVAEMKARLQILVDKGVITSEQMNQRLSFAESNTLKGKMKGGHHKGGFGGGFDF